MEPRSAFPSARCSEPLGQSVMVVDAEGKVGAAPGQDGAMAGPTSSSTRPQGGDQVIVNGLQKARPGATVKAVPWDPGGSRAGGPPARDACRVLPPDRRRIATADS
jgi:hypothetical protein